MNINQNIASGGLTLDGSTPPSPAPQPQTTPQPSPPQQSQPQQKGGVDRQALNLAHAIALAESGSKGSPNYNATGDNGTSHGAYQWNGAGHFASDAKSFGFDPNDSSPENQDKVAYAKIKAWKDKGYQPAEIASMWNSGSPNNWQNHSGTSNINGKAIHYDTPAYVQKVKQYYDQLSSSDNGYVNPPSLDLSSGSNTPNALPPEDTSTYNSKRGIAQKTAGFFGMEPAGQGIATARMTMDGEGNQSGTQNFQDSQDLNKVIQAIHSQTDPNVKQHLIDYVKTHFGYTMPQNSDQAEIDPGTKLSDKQVAGSFGNVLLNTLTAGSMPGEGAVTGVMSKGLPVAETLIGKTALTGKALKTASLGAKMAEGAATGYGYDVASKATNNQDNIYKPGLGTAVGGILPGLFGARGLGSSREESAVNKVQKAYEDALGATKTGVKANSKVLARGGGIESPAEFLANAGLSPETAEQNGRRIFTTGPESKTYQALQQRATDLTALRDQALEKSGAASSIEELRQAALSKAKEEFIGKDYQTAVDHINSEFDAFKNQPGVNEDGINSVNKIKKYFQGNTNFDQTRPSVLTKANKLVGDLAKTQVENDAEKAGQPGIKKINKIIQQHLDFLDTGNKKGILSKLNGQVVKGGKIGTYVKEAIGASMGSAAGKLLGGGLLGEIGGGIGGYYGGKTISAITQKLAVGGSRSAALLGRMATENPEVVDQILSNLGRSGEKVAPNVVPAMANKVGTKGDLMQKLISGAAANNSKQKMPHLDSFLKR